MVVSKNALSDISKCHYALPLSSLLPRKGWGNQINLGLQNLLSLGGGLGWEGLNGLQANDYNVHVGNTTDGDDSSLHLL